MALLDALKKRQQGIQTAAKQDVAGQAGTAQQVSGLLATKGGKAVAPGGPKQSALAEGAAIDEAKQALATGAEAQNAQANAFGVQEQGAEQQLAQQQAQLDTERQLGQEGLAAQATGAREALASSEQQALAKLGARERTQIDTTTAAADRAINDMLSQRGIAEDQIFQQFSEDNRELAFRRDNAQLEQLSQNMALRDKAYLDEINAIGETRNLTDSLEWQKETMRVMMGESVTDTLQKLGWQEADLTDDLAFNKQLAQMNIDDAIAVMNAEIAQNNQTSMISGLGSLAGIGVNEYFKPAADNTAVIKQAEDLWKPSTSVDTAGSNTSTSLPDGVLS